MKNWKENSHENIKRSGMEHKTYKLKRTIELKWFSEKLFSVLFHPSENTFCRDRLSLCLIKAMLFSLDVMSLFTVTKIIIKEQILWLSVFSSLTLCLGWSHLWPCGGTNRWFLGGRLPFYVLVSCRWLCWVHQSVHFSFPNFVMFVVDT